MPDIEIWVTQPKDKDLPGLEAVVDAIKKLGYVSVVETKPAGSVLSVSFEGGNSEQEQIENTIREAGYELFKVSHSERSRTRRGGEGFLEF